MTKQWLVIYQIKPDSLYCPLSHIVCKTIKHLQDTIISIDQYGYKLVDVKEVTE